MLRLFKEIFKSFSRNKVIIIGLSILVFFASAVFTLLFDISSSYKNQLNSYREVSGLQDLTVDLDLQASGNFPQKDKGGAFLNTTKIYRSQQAPSKRELLVFKSQFIKANRIFSDVAPDSYLKSSFLEEIYNGNRAINGVSVNKDTNTITFNNNDLEIPLYDKIGISLIPKKHPNVINNQTTFSILEPLSLSALARLNIRPDQAPFLSNLGSLYLNVRTHEATTNIAKSFDWEKKGELFTIKSDELAEVLGFTLDADNPESGFYFQNAIKPPNLTFNSTVEGVLGFGTTITGTLNLSSLVGDQIVQSDDFYLVPPQTVFSAAQENIIQRVSEVVFVREDYLLNFQDAVAKSYWSGTYLEAVQQLLNDSQKRNQINDFSFWKKEERIFQISGDGAFDPNATPNNTIDVSLNRSDLDLEIDDGSGLGPTTIKRLANINADDIVSDEEYANLTNVNIASERFNIINDVAIGIAKNSVINKTMDEFGELNVGMRKTVTFETVGDNQQQLIYHFINAGNADQVVDGIKQNVGKLYNEQFTPSSLFQIDTANEGYFSTEELPSDVSAKLVAALLNNFHVDSDFLTVDIYYQSLISNDEFGNTSIKNSNKIIAIKTKGQVNSGNQGVVFDNGALRIVNKKNDLWSYNSNISYTEATLAQYMVDNGLTISSRTINGAWARPTKENPDTISLPLQFLSPKPEVINEILTTGNLTLLQQAVENVLRKSGLFTNDFFNDQDIQVIVQSTIKAAKLNNLDSFLATGRGSSKSITRFGFDLIKIATEDFGDRAINNLLVKVLNRMKAIILENGNTLGQQREFLKTQIQNLLSTLKMFGMNDFLEGLPFGLSLDDIFDYIKDPIVFFDSLIQLINSFDLRAYSIAMSNRIDEIDRANENLQADQATNLLSSFDAFVPLFEHADQTLIKAGLNSLIDSIDFKALLSPSSQISIFNKLIAANPQANNQTTRDLFEKLNSAPDGSYSNINEAIQEILALFDLDSFISRIKLNAHQTTFKNPSGKEFVFRDLTNVQLLTSFISSIFQRDGESAANNDRQFKLSLIKLLNLSDEGEYNTTINAYLPSTSGTQKVGLGDISALTGLGPSSFENEEKLSAILKRIDDDSLTRDDIDFLKSTFPNIKDLSIANDQEIKDNINAYLELQKFYSFDIQDTITINFGTLVERILLQSSTNPIITTVVDQLKESISLDAVDSSGNLNSGYGKSIVDIANFLILLRNEYRQDDTQFLDQYQKIFSLFERQEGAINGLNDETGPKYRFAFMNELNAKELYGENSSNIGIQGLSISRSLAANARFTKELFANLEFQTFLDSLDQKTQDLINSDPKNFVNTLGIWASLDELLPSVFNFIKPSQTNNPQNLASILTDQNNILNTNKLVFDQLVRDAFSTRNLQDIFLSLHISPSILSPFLNLLVPQAVLWYTSNLNLGKNASPNDAVNQSNIAFLLTNKLVSFNTLTDDEIESFVRLLVSETSLSNAIESEGEEKVAFDYDFFLNAGISINNANDEGPSFFGINLQSIIATGLQELTFLKTDFKTLSFTDIGGYLAKVNDAFLVQNNKQIYTGEIPTDINEFNRFLEANKDQPWILDISGALYIIVGSETTADYLYPVINQKNIQVNTKTQALLYVNEKGFARAEAFAGGGGKNYLLVSYKGKDIANKKDKLENFISTQLNSSSSIPKVFLADELDSLNPERSLRVTAPLSTINAIDNFNTATLVILIFLVAITFIFITRRYIANKSVVLGILLAQGYTKSQIALSLTLFALVTSLIGGITGYVVGNGLQFFVAQLLSQFWSLPAQFVQFNFVSLLVTVFLPFLGMALLIYIVSLILLRNKAIDLMSGVTSLSLNKPSKKIYGWFKKTNIKTKYSVSLFLSSFWKLLWLMLSFSLTSFVVMFAISSQNVFSNAINSTYSNRNYNFKTDLVSPTVEGGAIQTFDFDDIQNNLYTPIGTTSEANLNDANFFAPGSSPTINDANNSNGIPGPHTPHILSSFSTNITVDVGIRTNPFETIFNSLPDTLKRQVTSDIAESGPLLEATQYDEDSGFELKRLDPLSNEVFVKKGETTPRNYFKFFQDLSGQTGFFYNRYSPGEGIYFPERLTVSIEDTDPDTGEVYRVRNAYRAFLVRAYEKLFTKNPQAHPFFVSFGGINYNANYDEGYTFIDVSNPSDATKKLRIYGYKNNSQFVRLIDSSGNNLYNTLNEFQSNDNVYPLVINLVTASKQQWGIGTRIAFNVDNKVDRYISQIDNRDNNPQVTFEVVGINPTFINDELITTQKVANEITGLDTLTTNSGLHFNGIFTSRDQPVRLTNSISFYSESGYYSALQDFDTSEGGLQNTFEEIFEPGGLLQNNAQLSEAQILNFLGNDNVTTINDFKASNQLMLDAIQKVTALYNNQLYHNVPQTLNSLDIEAGFISNISQTINSVLNNVILISIIISVIILVIISSILIGENERNIALFSILGYNNKEKIKLFFYVFVPFIAFATILSSGLVFGAIYVFNNFLISAASIALPLNLQWWHVVATMLVSFAIFLGTSTLSWFSINKIKPIILMSRKN